MNLAILAVGGGGGVRVQERTLHAIAMPRESRTLYSGPVNPMHLTDSHAHLDMLSGDLAEVLARAQAAGVRTILAIGIGEGPDEMQRALEIAKKFRGQPATPAIYASAGIHPQEAHRADAGSLAKLARLAAGRAGDRHRRDRPGLLPRRQPRGRGATQLHSSPRCRWPPRRAGRS